MLGALTGTAAHLWRDVCEPGTGVPLLWPITKRPFSIGYRNYAAPMLVLGVAMAVDRWLTTRRGVPDDSATGS